MGLLGNNHRANFGSKLEWGTVLAMTPGNSSRYCSHCYTRTQEGASTVLSQTAIPSGGYPPATFFPPQEAGQITLRPLGQGDLTASMFLDKTMSIDFTGSGTLSADLGLVVSMLCDMIGSGTLAASIVGVLTMEVDMTGYGGLSADVKGVASMMIDMLGSGDLDAVIAGYGNMSIDMVVTGTGLSTANIGQYVWTALINEFSSNPDSAAAKLLGASSAGDPWSTNLPASYTGTQAGQILAQIQTLVDELHRVQGLDETNPATTTQTSIDAGTIHIDITGDGENSTTFTRND